TWPELSGNSCTPARTAGIALVEAISERYGLPVTTGMLPPRCRDSSIASTSFCVAILKICSCAFSVRLVQSFTCAVNVVILSKYLLTICSHAFIVNEYKEGTRHDLHNHSNNKQWCYRFANINSRRGYKRFCHCKIHSRRSQGSNSHRIIN